MADDRALYNRGAELVASEQFDEAVETLRQAAVVRDRTIAAKALSLLGQIATGSAKQNVSENPAETTPEQRQNVVDHLKSAEQSFADSLSLQSNDDVRQYLETIRAWRYNMTNAWEEYDREQQRKNELMQQVQWLADWENKLIEKVRPLLEESNSPKKFQVGYESARDHNKLTEELTRLEDIPVNDDELKEKWKHLPEIKKTAEEATELLEKHRLDEALPKQQQVLDYLRSLLMKDQNQDQQKQEQECDQDQQNQDQQEQSQNSDASKDGDQKEEQTSDRSQQDGAIQNDETSEEKAERQLIQVRRKEQAAKEMREQIRALQLQAGQVEKDW
jgi:hypothetical protein